MEARDRRPTTLIVGLLANKDAAGWFAPLVPLRPRVLTVGGYADAAAAPEHLARVAQDLGLEAGACSELDGALARALAMQGPPPRVLIAGSLYLAGEVLSRSPETWPT